MLISITAIISIAISIMVFFLILYPSISIITYTQFHFHSFLLLYKIIKQKEIPFDGFINYKNCIYLYTLEALCQSRNCTHDRRHNRKQKQRNFSDCKRCTHNKIEHTAHHKFTKQIQKQFLSANISSTKKYALVFIHGTIVIEYNDHINHDRNAPKPLWQIKSTHTNYKTNQQI